MYLQDTSNKKYLWQPQQQYKTHCFIPVSTDVKSRTVFVLIKVDFIIAEHAIEHVISYYDVVIVKNNNVKR